MADVNAITPEDLAARLEQPDLLLIQVTSGEVFAQARIPGAVCVTPPELVDGTPPASGKLPNLTRLQTLFERVGYQPEAKVVVYDDEGGGWAGRLGWTLDVIGHRSWDYLDGGLHSWVGAGFALDQGSITPPTPSRGLNITIDRAPIAEVEDVLHSLDDPSSMVWDVRSREEYLGQKQVSARCGHIPGAVNYDWLLLKDERQNLNADAHSALENLGLGPERSIITHCQTHHRSGLSYMWGRLQGWNIRAYHGSWSEWGNLEDTPIDNPNAAH